MNSVVYLLIYTFCQRHNLIIQKPKAFEIFQLNIPLTVGLSFCLKTKSEQILSIAGTWENEILYHRKVQMYQRKGKFIARERAKMKFVSCSKTIRNPQSTYTK